MENRRFLRFDLPGRAQVTFDRPGAHPVSARLQNFSRQGIALETEHSNIPQAEAVYIDFTPAWETLRTFSIQGRIVWQRAQEDGCCKLGIAIQNIRDADRSYLLENSYRLWATLRKYEYDTVRN